MNSNEIFKQNQYLKQLIQNRQLQQRLKDPFSCWLNMPPTLLYGYDPMQNHQFDQDIRQSDMHLHQSIPKYDSTLSYPTPTPLKWPKSRNAEDVEFEYMTGQNPNSLLFHDLTQLGLANRISGQVNPLYKDQITPIYDGFGLTPEKFTLAKSLKNRITFLEHEKDRFKHYNRYW